MTEVARKKEAGRKAHSAPGSISMQPLRKRRIVKRIWVKYFFGKAASATWFYMYVLMNPIILFYLLVPELSSISNNQLTLNLSHD